MKSLLVIFLSLLFLVSCGQRANLKLSPPYSFKAQLNSSPSDDASLDAIKGSLSITEGDQVKEISFLPECHPKKLEKGLYLFSCLSFENRSHLLESQALNLRSLEFDIHFALASLYSASSEIYIYVPKSKRLELVAEHEWQKTKNETKILKESLALEDEFFFVLRLKRYDQLDSELRLHEWKNTFDVSLESFQTEWELNEKVKSEFSFNENYTFKNLQVGSNLVFTFSGTSTIPRYLDVSRSIPYFAFSGSGHGQIGGSSKRDNCKLKERFFQPVTSDINFREELFKTHLRVVLADEERTLSSLLSEHRANILNNGSSFSLEIEVTEAMAQRGIRFYVGTYNSEKNVVGLVDYGTCSAPSAVFRYLEPYIPQQEHTSRGSESFQGVLVQTKKLL